MCHPLCHHLSSPLKKTVTEIQNKYRKGHSVMFWNKSPFAIDFSCNCFNVNSR